MEKSKIYDNNYQEYQSKYDEIKSMSKIDITQVIMTEQERLLKRKNEIDAKVEEANLGVGRINQQKEVLMNKAMKIMAEGEVISQKNNQIKQLSDEMKVMQDNVLKWTKDLETEANVELFNKINTTKESLMSKYKAYQEMTQKDDYHQKIELHNIQRRELSEEMKSVDIDVEYHSQLRKALTIQIEEVNTQIKSLNAKQAQFKNAADYLNKTR